MKKKGVRDIFVCSTVDSKYISVPSLNIRLSTLKFGVIPSVPAKWRQKGRRTKRTCTW